MAKHHTWSATDISPHTVILLQRIFYWVFKGILTPIWSFDVKSQAPRLKKRQKLVIAANHTSIYDAFIALLSLPWADFKLVTPVRPIMKDAYISVWWQKIFLLPFGCFSAADNGGVRGLELAQQFVESGQTLFIFPEGKILHGDQRVEPRVGIIKICLATDSKVLPIKISLRHSRPRYFCRIGQPIEIASVPDGDHQPAANALMERIYSLE